MSLPLIQMVLAHQPYGRRLRTLVANGLGKSHLLPRREIFKTDAEKTVAVEVYLAPVGRGDEAMVTIWVNCRDLSVRRYLVRFDMTLPLPGEILQLPSCRVKGISDCDINTFVCTGLGRFAANGDVCRTRHRDVNANLIKITFRLPSLRAGNDHPR